MFKKPARRDSILCFAQRGSQVVTDWNNWAASLAPYCLREPLAASKCNGWYVMLARLLATWSRVDGLIYWG